MVIYGYTWNVRKLNDGAGDYRITFSFDQTGTNGVNLNTSFEEGITKIFIPVETEEEITATEETDFVITSYSIHYTKLYDGDIQQNYCSSVFQFWFIIYLLKVYM